MSRIIRSQTNFTSGEIDPKLRARIDLRQYYNGLETGRNIVIQPQGGMQRRDGTRFIAELPASAGTAVRTVHFEFSVNDSYMLIFVDERMYVFKNGAQVTNINGSGDDYLDVPEITDAVIPTMCWAQSADTLIICQEDMKPQRILRGANDSSWTVSDVDFVFIPKFAYAFSVSNPAANLTVDQPDGNITVTASSGVFNSGYVNQYLNINPQGRLRVIEFVNSTTIKAYAEVPLFDDSGIDSGSWELEEGYEDTWSNTRGWPRSATFYEGRLYFGGASSRPSTLWGSRVADFFNFDPGESLDDAALEATLDTGRFNAIVDLYAGRNLQIFTTGAEFLYRRRLATRSRHQLWLCRSRLLTVRGLAFAWLTWMVPPYSFRDRAKRSLSLFLAIRLMVTSLQRFRCSHRISCARLQIWLCATQPLPTRATVY